MPLSVNECPAPKVGNRRKPKSRNGCGRCKLKRLKCDETSPSCLQCQKRTVPCPGYEKKLKWSTKYEVFPKMRNYGPPNHTFVAQGDVLLPQDLSREIEAVVAVLPEKKAEKEEPATTLDLNTSTTKAGRRPPATSNSSTGINETTRTIFNDHAVPLIISNRETFIFCLNTPSNTNTADPIDYRNERNGHDYGTGEETLIPPQRGGIVEIRSSLANGPSMHKFRAPLLPILRPTDTIESSLIQHYFREVCVLFSSFDSLLNPFRTAIGRLYQESPSLYYAIQSMAAAHLANIRTDMNILGRQMQRKASTHLQLELPMIQSGKKNGTATFLSIILLGMTTTWHESSALGEDFLVTARSLILPTLLGTSKLETRRETRFFEESMIYWEMLMGFVTSNDTSCYLGSSLQKKPSRELAPIARNRFGMIIPHPWTGIAPSIQIIFAEVGRLVRRERLLHMGALLDHGENTENLLLATALEEDLLAAEYPLAEELADPGDIRTAKRDFIVMAEAYRCTGLLELYRVFLPLLRKRMGTGTPPFSTHTTPTVLENATTSLHLDSPHDTTDTDLWINSLALYILDLLASLPSSSGTCCLQPILLVAAASELKLVTSLDFFDIYANDTRVRDARAFVNRRLEEYAVRLPAKPLRKTIELVREVWRRLDGGEDAFWIDVMVEKGWGTLMG